jgi:hypothetical protein
MNFRVKLSWEGLMSEETGEPISFSSKTTAERPVAGAVLGAAVLGAVLFGGLYYGATAIYLGLILGCWG